MPDTFTKAERSRIMAAVKGKDTKPEMVVRRLVWGLGYRYRLHVRSVPGCPDLVFRSRRKAIFVHGCFWHRHWCSGGRSMPASRVKYWRQKFARNMARDVKHRRRLSRMGWRVLTIWECQTGKPDRLESRLKAFLQS
ncbi:MAG: very short patch repair endonuclease [Planctomycetota bacterium]|nr:very short patch repair endonuclease [Planctomycetota bacterium]